MLIHPHIPIRDIWWLAAGGGAGYGARYVRLRVQLVRNQLRRAHTIDPTDELLRLQGLYGYNAHSLVSITPGAATWSMPGIDGAIVYGEFGRVWLAAGDPLAHVDDIQPLVIGFMAAASKARRIAAFVPATDRFAREAVKVGLSAVKIGAAPYFDLRTWQPRGNSAKHMRAGVNKAVRAGVRVEVIKDFNPAFRKEVAELCMQWLKARRAAASFGWLLSLDPLTSAERKKLFVARDTAKRLVGMVAASPVPARDGWYLEDVLRSPTAPSGTADLLVHEALIYLRQSGASLATLGTAPLARDGQHDVSTHDHPVIERSLIATARRLSPLYDFEGLRRFKGKFVPSWWESEYALVQHGVLVPSRVAHALWRAIVPGGLKHLLARQTIRSIRR